MSGFPTVLCINPPIYDFAAYDLFHKPLGLSRLSRWFQDSGWNVSFIDALNTGDPKSIEQLGQPRRKANGTGKFFRQEAELPGGFPRMSRRYSRYGILAGSLAKRIGDVPSPDLICITSGMTYWYPGVRETVEICRSLWPRVPVVTGGIYSTLMPEHCLQVCKPDHVCRGSAVTGLPPLLKLLGLPVPGPFSGDCFHGGDADWKISSVLRMNEGCPFKCEYCASRVIQPGFLPGSWEKVFDQLEYEYTKKGVRHFAFYDDALLVNKEANFLPFLERVITSGFDVSFYLPNAVHIQFMDRETAGLMKKAGFREIRLGYESDDESFHEKYDGKYTGFQFQKSLQYLSEAGFLPGEVAVYILAGLPGQKWEEVEQTIRSASSENARCRIAQYSPLPGSALWDEAVRLSSYDLTEPLYHNNTFFPMEWEGFSRQDISRLRLLCNELNQQL